MERILCTLGWLHTDGIGSTAFNYGGPAAESDYRITFGILMILAHPYHCGIIQFFLFGLAYGTAYARADFLPGHKKFKRSYAGGDVIRIEILDH